MLDLVKSIRFPTAGEVRQFFATYHPKDAKCIMCTLSGEPHHAVGSFVEGYEEFKMVPGLSAPQVGFHPVFEMRPEYAPYEEESIKYIVAFGSEGSGASKVFYPYEPTPKDGMPAVHLGPLTYILAQPLPYALSWVDAETMCGELEQHKYVFCPGCGALHKMPYSAVAKVTSTTVRCRNCGNIFVASHVSRSGILERGFQHLSNCHFDFLVSDGIEPRMENASPATTLVNGWPASQRSFNKEDLFDNYRGGGQTAKALLDALFGKGWDAIDEQDLLGSVEREWGQEHVEPVTEFLHLWGKGRASGIKPDNQT